MCDWFDTCIEPHYFASYSDIIPFLKHVNLFFIIHVTETIKNLFAYHPKVMAFEHASSHISQQTGTDITKYRSESEKKKNEVEWKAREQCLNVVMIKFHNSQFTTNDLIDTQ